MEILLLEPDVSWGKFKILAWFAALSIVLVYVVLRVEAYMKFKSLTVKSIVLKCSFLPVLFLTVGYLEHLDRFYSFAIQPNGNVILNYVFPEGKKVALEPEKAWISHDRAGCAVYIKAQAEHYKSVMSIRVSKCRQAVDAI
ncbi:hypothetical protein C9J44_13120 [Photobacterium sp. GB-27]|uniref:hypothetical protein n=1 Tax=Photobacterium sp. GB-27 TaxID=2022109 RepID=UPI000D1518FC|nr:hypothetical protein [Photobacterium sp. GB-27]PSV35409.1 hypothetical protein C9J44_13120 [Photobacterium sp. GB-27]